MPRIICVSGVDFWGRSSRAFCSVSVLLGLRFGSVVRAKPVFCIHHSQKSRVVAERVPQPISYPAAAAAVDMYDVVVDVLTRVVPPSSRASRACSAAFVGAA